MLSQVKTRAIVILAPIILAIIFSSCGVTLEQSYYDEDFQGDVMPTTSKTLCCNDEGECVVGWALWTRNTLYLVLQLQYSAANHHRFEMPQGDYLSFDFADGSTYHLVNSSAVRSRRGSVQGEADQYANVYIPLSNDDVNALLSKPIVGLNVQTNTRNSRFTIKSNKDAAIKKMINLLQPTAPILKLPRIR